MQRHLAVFSKVGAKLVLEGKKTVETRFSKNKIAPFGKVFTGDIVYVKPVGGEIAGQFKVTKVLSFDGLEKEDWEFIKTHYGKRLSLGVDEDKLFFSEHKNANFGTVIFMDEVERFITSPVKISKKDHRGWVVLD